MNGASFRWTGRHRFGKRFASPKRAALVACSVPKRPMQMRSWKGWIPVMIIIIFDRVSIAFKRFKSKLHLEDVIQINVVRKFVESVSYLITF